MNVITPIWTTGERIRKARRDYAKRLERTVSQAEFARVVSTPELKITAAQIEAWERDHSTPHMKGLFAIADVTGVRLGWLMAAFQDGGVPMPRADYEDITAMNARLDAEGAEWHDTVGDSQTSASFGANVARAA